MNILIAINNAYIDYAKTMLYSLKINNPVEYDIYLMYNQLNRQGIQSMQKFCSQNSMQLHPIHVADTELEGMTLGNAHFSIEMYYRIFVQKYVPETLDRILWLDADIVVDGSITEFYNMDMDGQLIAACADCGWNSEETVIRCKNKLNLPEEHVYFNSGVILFDLNAIRKQLEFGTILDTLKRYQDVLVFPDQDILNVLYDGKTKMISKRFNYQIGLERKKADVQKDAAVVLHFTGSVKPWHPNYEAYCAEYYWKYALKRGQWINFLKMWFHRIIDRK